MKIKRANRSRNVHTNEELQQIAKDLLDNKIFSDRHCKNEEEVMMCFPILTFLEEKTIEGMLRDKIDFIFEYYEKAAPRTINGMPMFFSCHVLSKKETKEMFEYYEAMKKFREEGERKFNKQFMEEKKEEKIEIKRRIIRRK